METLAPCGYGRASDKVLTVPMRNGNTKGLALQWLEEKFLPYL